MLNLYKTFVSASAYIISDNMFSLKPISIQPHIDKIKRYFELSGVSPNVVWTFIPAVATSLKNAVFALYFVKKPASAQKVHYYHN
jgi:hypothetical protein